MIERFRGEYFFLSNMYPVQNWIETDLGIMVPTSEHAYQAAKFQMAEDYIRVAEARAEEGDNRIYADGLAAKELATEMVLEGALVVEDWDIARRGIMKAIVRRKFLTNPDIAAKLLATGDEEIFEGNDWGDRYWGVDPIGSRDGQNQMGQIHMEVRDELRAA